MFDTPTNVYEGLQRDVPLHPWGVADRPFAGAGG